MFPSSIYTTFFLTVVKSAGILKNASRLCYFVVQDNVVAGLDTPLLLVMDWFLLLFSSSGVVLIAAERSDTEGSKMKEK